MPLIVLCTFNLGIVISTYIQEEINIIIYFIEMGTSVTFKCIFMTIGVRKNICEFDTEPSTISHLFNFNVILLTS